MTKYNKKNIFISINNAFYKCISLKVAEQSRAEQSRAEQSRAEQSRAEQSRAEQSRAEQSRGEEYLLKKSECKRAFVEKIGVQKGVC